MNVCEALVDILTEYGVKYIFGIPGDSINELIEAIRKQDKIRFIHVMHEEAGAFAASAQAKLTGELAVCCGTSGPGAIHLLNGLYDAKLDHAPVLAITGQVDTSLMGIDSHQEAGLTQLFSDVSFFNQTVINPHQMPELAILACQTALVKRGVSHISIPVNIATRKVEDYKSRKPHLRPRAVVSACEEDLLEAAALINHSSRPCILAGIGARDAVTPLVEFAALIQAPIVKALRGKDILPDVHPYVLGGIGLLGTEPAYHAIKNCDLLVTVGSDFPYTDFYPSSDVPTIQIDNKVLQIGRRHPVSVPLHGDAGSVLRCLVPLISEKNKSTFLEDCQRRMDHWLQEQNEVELSTEVPIHPQAVARYVAEKSADDAIICCDTGSVTVWCARNFRIKGEQRFTLSGGLASMGYGLPAAIGAKLAFPSQQVIAFCGDGGFAMLMADFATAVKYSLAVKIFVFNNSKLGMIQMEQEGGNGNPEYETDLNNPDYAVFAKACGGEGYTVRKIEELHAAVSLVLASERPCIANVFIKKDEITYPPHIEFKEAFNYIKAKTKEYFSPARY